MWTPEERVLVGDYGSGQAMSDDQFRVLEPLIPPAKPGGRPRTTDLRRLLDGLFYLVRTGCQWRHLPPPPAFPPWPTVYGAYSDETARVYRSETARRSDLKAPTIPVSNRPGWCRLVGRFRHVTRAKSGSSNCRQLVCIGC